MKNESTPTKNSTLAATTHIERTLPELAAALRLRGENIVLNWMQEARRTIPVTQNLSDVELRDNLPAILSEIADLVAVNTRDHVHGLMRQSPAQGSARFMQQYDVRELMSEDRLLRQVIIEQVETALGRRMIQTEQIALDRSIDIMLQESVIAFTTEQQEKLRSAAEAELKYLSFLSHDLDNNLNSVTLMLQLLRRKLGGLDGFEEEVKSLDAAQQSILDTLGGMGRLLQSERLRKAGVRPERRPIALAKLAAQLVQVSMKSSTAKGLKIAIEIPHDCVCQSDGELVGVILQNLIGNAVKFSDHGTVLVSAVIEKKHCVISVSDQGPGIAAEHLDTIFDSFRRGENHVQPGVGLGLTIASQAANLLGGTLTVASKVGEGSTFTLTLPA